MLQRSGLALRHAGAQAFAVRALGASVRSFCNTPLAIAEFVVAVVHKHALVSFPRIHAWLSVHSTATERRSAGGHIRKLHRRRPWRIRRHGHHCAWPRSGKFAIGSVVSWAFRSARESVARAADGVARRGLQMRALCSTRRRPISTSSASMAAASSAGAGVGGDPATPAVGLTLWVKKASDPDFMALDSTAVDVDDLIKEVAAALSSLKGTCLSPMTLRSAHVDSEGKVISQSNAPLPSFRTLAGAGLTDGAFLILEIHRVAEA